MLLVSKFQLRIMMAGMRIRNDETIDDNLLAVLLMLHKLLIPVEKKFKSTKAIKSYI